MRPPVFHPSGKSREQREAERKAALDAQRPSAADRGYDADWRCERDAYLLANPICSTPGCGQPATEVDHILSVLTHPWLRLVWANFRGFCKPCHSRRTAFEQAFGRGGIGGFRSGAPRQ